MPCKSFKEHGSECSNPVAYSLPAAPHLPNRVNHKSCDPFGQVFFPAVGSIIGDYRLDQQIGRGGFGVVFLAWQNSMDRHVALKITPDIGSEARIMAPLDHDRIVQVFSESTHNRLRLLSMRYIAGATLQQVLDRARNHELEGVDGKLILETAEHHASRPASLDPQKIRYRDDFSRSNSLDAVCRVGIQLAEALAYAHKSGVRHCDIKPANILFDQYGRPFLADFNLSVLSGREHELRGGTLLYMAPEQIVGWRESSSTNLTDQSDIFSLGVILHELLTLQLPYETPSESLIEKKEFREIAQLRCESLENRRVQSQDIPDILIRTIEDCIAPNPKDRYGSCEELTNALQSCQRLQQIHRSLPAGGFITHNALRHPFGWIVIITILPHLLASILNVTYNKVNIVNHFEDRQKNIFLLAVIAYNAVVYPFCTWLLIRSYLPVQKTWDELYSSRSSLGHRVSQARHLVLRWPMRAVAIGCLGWLPGGVCFPFAIHFWGAVESPVSLYVHFGFSFTLSCLIAVAYSLAGVQYLTLRVFYPRLWWHTESVGPMIEHELARVSTRHRLIQTLAGSIPLGAALMLICVGAEGLSGFEYRLHQLSLLLLISLGACGFYCAMNTIGILERTVNSLCLNPLAPTDHAVSKSQKCNVSRHVPYKP